MQQDSTEDVVDVDFEEAVPLVDGVAELLSDFERVADAVAVGVDHDRVGIAVDDLEHALFGEFLCAAQDFAALEGCEHGEWAGVEAGTRVA